MKGYLLIILNSIPEAIHYRILQNYMNPAVVQAVMQSEPRADVRITLPDGRVFSGAIGTKLETFVDSAFPDHRSTDPVLGAVIDNRLTELTTPVVRDVTVRPIQHKDSDGGRIYQRSLAFLMTTALEACFPGVKVAVEHSIPSGGYFCQPLGRAPFTADELAALKSEMHNMVAQDLLIKRSTLPLVDARKIFADQHDDDMVRLLEFRSKPYLTVYELAGKIDYFFGYMTPSTGYLQRFDLIPAADGFILVFPRPEKPGMVQVYHESEQLERIFRQTNDWLNVMALEDVGRLNESIAAGRFREEVLIAESLHSRMFGEMARTIAERHAHGLKVIMIAGPSSAGKTTSSKRLAVQLMAYGLQPYTLAMDNYFVDRDLTPKDESGAYDFEALGAVNLERFNQDLIGLTTNQEVQLPLYDFRTGKSGEGEVVKLPPEAIIIIEGIHGLNPELVKDLPPERVFRIYISALTALNLNRHNRIPTTDVRLLRRMVRDATHRGYSAQDTLDRWESVRRGEKRNIFPYQENADVMFNSSLAYELAVLRPFAEPLLRQIDLDSPRYIEAKRLLAFLSWVRPADAEFVPNQSLLREFVGGSILETYTPGMRVMATVARSSGQQ